MWGAPVIGSNCTSIPEIIDREDALFDPRQPQDIASRMAEVLSNADLRQSLKTWGLERAKAFTWEACARKALRAFETLHAERKAHKLHLSAPPRDAGRFSPLWLRSRLSGLGSPPTRRSSCPTWHAITRSSASSTSRR